MFKVGDVIPGDLYADQVPRVVIGWRVRVRGAATPRWVETFGAHPTTTRHRERAHRFTSRKLDKAEVAFWGGARLVRIVAKCPVAGVTIKLEDTPLYRLASDMFDGAVVASAKANVALAVLQEIARVAQIRDDEPLVEALAARLAVAQLGAAA